MKGNALDLYTLDAPSHDLAFKIFDGTWLCDVPGYGHGDKPIFSDSRIPWFGQLCGGFEGKSVLELGPLEGAHTYMLAKGGAHPILSIESNSRSFLKCLIVKNALRFNAEFMYGDFRKFLEKRESRFDLLLASGVLYHMTDPVSLLENMAYASDSICIWTHYFDREVFQTNKEMRKRIDEVPECTSFRGIKVETHRHRYLDGLQKDKFIGGSHHTSQWMTRESIESVLGALGMSIVVGSNDMDHPAGPAILLYATRLNGFDESRYLRLNPDVAEAVEGGQFYNGAEHFIRFGNAEGRPLA